MDKKSGLEEGATYASQMNRFKDDISRYNTVIKHLKGNMKPNNPAIEEGLVAMMGVAIDTATSIARMEEFKGFTGLFGINFPGIIEQNPDGKIT